MSKIHKIFPKIAIVADQMTAFGGADREMFSMLKILPNADIYTIVFNEDKYPNIKNRIYTSSVQKLSNILPSNFHRHLKIFTPLAYENFDLRGYDLVISISAGPGKGVITTIDQPHVAMIMTPPRSLWDKELNVRGSRLKSVYKPISKILNTYMRVWDWTISKRVDYWTANSKFISNKILKIYKQKATVLYPGVEEMYFEETPKGKLDEVKENYDLPEQFVLVVSRLYDHKRVDWAIRACKKANKNLVIIGDGPDRKYLEKVANKDNRIFFLGFLPEDSDVKAIYQLSQVLLFCGLEDFGLVPVEAMASGTPVIAYGQGGLLETVAEGKTGEFFQTEKELTQLLMNFNKKRYNRQYIEKHAKRFSEEKFLNNLEKYLYQIHEKEQKRKEK